MKNEVLHLKKYYDFLGNNNCDPVVEIYLPYNMTEMKRENLKRPCMIVVPGGGYAMCSQREKEPIAVNYLSLGFNVFVLTYSCAPNRFPTQILEVASLVDLIYKNNEQWNCDTNKISIIGFSAGAHLAAHYTTMYNCKEVREKFPDSHPVNACLLCYPVITACKEFAHMGSIINLIGHEPSNQEETDYFSCEKHVTSETPPTFIWHTAEDGCVPVANSLLYASALSEYKVPFELHIYPFGWHGLSTSDAQTCNNPDNKMDHVHNWVESSQKWLKLIFNI